MTKLQLHCSSQSILRMAATFEASIGLWRNEVKWLRQGCSLRLQSIYCDPSGHSAVLFTAAKKKKKMGQRSEIQSSTVPMATRAY